jgi:hypothetical protein
MISGGDNAVHNYFMDENGQSITVHLSPQWP